MSAFSKLTDKVIRFDRGLGKNNDAQNEVRQLPSLGMLDNFHISGDEHSVADQKTQDGIENTLSEKTYADGLADGRAQALSEAEAQSAHNFELAENLGRAVQTISANIEASHARVLTKILIAVLPALAQKNQRTALKDFIMQISAPAMNGTVNILAPEHFQVQLGEIIQDIPNAASNKSDGLIFEIISNPKNQDGHSENLIHAKWEGGGATIDIDGAVKQCLALLKEHTDNERGYENG